MNIVSQLEENIKKIFPKSYVSVRVEKGLGEPHIAISFTLGNKDEYPNGISQNDKAKQIIFIYGVDSEGNPKSGKLSSEIVQGQSITVLPTEKFLAYGRIKTGWRNFSGNEKNTVKRITKYFDNLMVILIDSYDSGKLTEDAKKLMVEKGYIEIAALGKKIKNNTEKLSKDKIYYHGSQNPNIVFKKNAYFTDNKETAISFADRSFMGESLLKGEIPTLYSVNLKIKNPKIITSENDYEKYFQDTSSNENIKNQGYDSIIYNPKDDGDNYYLIFNPNQIKIIDKTIIQKKLSKGGKLVGASHDEGGIDIIVPNGKIEAEGGEIIINKKSSDKYCSVLSKINESEGGNKIPCGKGSEEAVFKKGGNIPSVEKRVSEVNRLIKLANENNISVVDTSGTWQAPMKYKPLKYSNGVLYVEYEQLDLYKNNRSKGEIQEWKTVKDKVLKKNFEFDNPIPQISRMYKKALKDNNINFDKAENGMKTESGENKKYKVVKIFRKSGRREVLEKNLTREQAIRVVNSYPNSNTSMVVFYSMAEKGDRIENQYKGRIAKDIWESWTVEQKRHFISDHVYKITELAKVLKEKLNKDLFFYVNTNFFENLPKSFQREISYHLHEGEYKKGGKTTKTVFKSVDTRNVNGLDELLNKMRAGWKIVSNTYYTVQLKSPVKERISETFYDDNGKSKQKTSFVKFKAAKGSKIDEFLNKKHDIKGAFKKGIAKTKDLYNRSSDSVKKKIRDNQKQTAINVLEDVKGKVKLNQYKESINESEDLVKELYSKGNKISKKVK